MSVRCSGRIIESKTSVTYLGLTLDQATSGEAIATKVLNKCASRIKFLYRNTRFFNLNTKKLLVQALIQCHYDYACSSWYSGLSQKLKYKLQVMQNNTIRYLLHAHPRTHVGQQEFVKVGMLPTDLRVEQLKLNHMYQIVNKSAPDYLSTDINMVRDLHSHNTRASVMSCQIPKVFNVMGRSTFCFTGVMLWNSLPLQLKMCQSRASFKNGVKSFLWEKLIGCK